MSSDNRSKHKDCYFCGEAGYLFADYVIDGRSISAGMRIQDRHEGWPGIPHGGIGMTALIELSDLLDASGQRYPMEMNFRFGGDTIKIGDDVRIEGNGSGDGFSGVIQKMGGKHPYLKGTIHRASTLDAGPGIGKMADLLDRPVAVKSSVAMPDFTNRIIFRQEYLPAHRSRVFEIRELSDGRVYMICFLTDTGGQMTGGELNLLSGDEVHPGSLITILDETLGWAGFLSVWQGGVTVGLSALFLRPVRQDEILFSVGLCEKVSGSFKRRILNCSGCMFSLGSGVPEPVVYATGKWFTRPDYKERLLDCLLPKGNLTQARAIQRRMHPGEGD